MAEAPVQPIVFSDTRAGSINCSIIGYPGDYRMSAHAHAEHHLILCLDGAIEHSSGLKTLYISPQAAGCVPAGSVHSNVFRDWALALTVEIGEIQNEAYPPVGGDAIFSSQHPLKALLSSAYQELRKPDRFTPMMLESLAMEMLVSLYRDRTHNELAARSPRWLERARELLHEDLSEALTVSQIAAEVGVHPAHLAKTFRRQFGKSIGEYGRCLRIAHARHLLESSDMSIGAIASATGFVDQSHFTRTFRLHTGRTPLSYRKAL
ncbi:MAG: helix-turn-helix domain-containing protein [Armatimonadetes bacterium]|nr:helix-turn-helix domain-containing protein [Armatimonadota bacterium]